MRHSWLLLLLIVAAGCGKAPPPAPAVATPVAAPPVAGPAFLNAPLGDADPGPLPEALRQETIPQDAERMKRVRAERLASLRASGVEAYAKVGNRNAKWDAAATDALEKVATAKEVHDRDGDAVEAAFAALTEAVRLGCDDPYVRYMHTRYTHVVAPGKRTPADAQAELAAVSRVLQASRYPAVRRANGAHNANIIAPAPKTLDAVTETLRSEDWAAEIALAVQAVRDDPRGGAEDYVDLARLSQIYFGSVPGGRDKAYEVFRDALDGVPQADALRLWLKGKFLLDRGWAARGAAIAALVPDEKMRAFTNDMVAAAEAFEAAWDLDPTRSEIAVGRMSTAGPLGEFDELEAWFRKAMTVDGDCYRALDIKGNFLQPKWGGHSEAVRQFAARVAETRNWHAMLPLAAINLLSVADTRQLRPFMAERDWPAVQGICDDLVKERPDSRWAWSLYAKSASTPLRPAAVLRAAEHIGDKPSRLVFRTGEFEELCENAKILGPH